MGLDLLPSNLPLPQLCIVAQDDACLVANCKLLQTLHPLFIEFISKAHGGVGARWANEEEQGVLQQKLATSVKAILDDAHNSADRVPIIHLDSLINTISINSLAMPTFNGCMLGYPVCYAVHDLLEAQAASRCLSTTTLRLFSVFTSLKPRIESENDDSPLFSFSLPLELRENEIWGSRRRAWEAALRQRHAAAVAAGMPWGQLSIEETSCMRGIAL